MVCPPCKQVESAHIQVNEIFGDALGCEPPRRPRIFPVFLLHMRSVTVLREIFHFFNPDQMPIHKFAREEIEITAGLSDSTRSEVRY